MIKDKNLYNILIVEDNLGDFTIVEDLLLEQITRPSIVRAISYKQTETIIATTATNFDVVLLDLTLPDKSGEDLINAIVKLITNCPIIVLTGFTNIDFGIKSIALGIADYLLKDELTASMLYKSIIYTLERKKTITELRESEKRYSYLFHSSPLPMWVFDVETLRFVQINKAAIEHYGYSEAEFLEMVILDIRPDSEIDKTMAIIQDIRHHAKGVFKDNFKHQKKSGEIIDVEASKTPLIINNRLFISVVANDVTEKNLYEQNITKAIIKTQEEERYDVGSELHDNVCQILTTSKIAFKMIEKALPENKLPIFNDGIESLNLAFKEIRNLSHRLAPVFLDDTTLEQAFGNTLKAFNVDNHHKIVLQFDDAFKEYPTTKDFQLNLFRILQEQLSNILKYAQATTITVQGFIKNNQLVLSIADDGIGFNSHLASTGIGLSNMKRRAELFNGKFSVDTAPGLGCKLTIEVPLKDVD